MSRPQQSNAVTAPGGAGQLVAQAMVTCPKVHSPYSSVARLRALFEDEHVHMALIVAPDERLLTTIVRSDLGARVPNATSVVTLGTLAGRTVAPSDPLAPVTAQLRRQQRRRMAVVDATGHLVGLLCLKRDGSGYCSDDGVRARAAAAVRSRDCVAR
jgi:CBS-domain-containing membrane protein